MTTFHIQPRPHMERLYLPACSQLPEHSHSVDIDLIIERGRVCLHRTGRTEWLEHGDCRFVPAGQPHAIIVGLEDTTLGLVHHFPPELHLSESRQQFISQHL